MSRPAAFIALLLAWAGLTGSIAPQNLLLGGVLSAVVLLLLRHQLGGRQRPVRPVALFRLILLFLRELALSVWAVTRTVLRRDMRLDPAIVTIPLHVNDDFRIALLANLITLTPGTLTVDVSDDRRALHVHALDGGDPDGLRRNIAEGFERRIREAFP